MNPTNGQAAPQVFIDAAPESVPSPVQKAGWLHRYRCLSQTYDEFILEATTDRLPDSP